MLWSMFLLAAGLSVDALMAAFAYALRGVRIPWFARVVIGLCSFGYALLAVWAGQALQGVVAVETARWLGVGTLAIMGVRSIHKAIRDGQSPPCAQTCLGPEWPKEEKTLLNWAIRSLGITICVVRNPSLGDLDNSQVIDGKEALLLGLALSVDAIGAGMAAALTGLVQGALPMIIAGVQVLFLWLGSALGRRTAHKLPHRLLDVAPGCMLLCIALLRALS